MRKALLVMAVLALQGCAYHRLVVASGEGADQTYHPIESSAIGWGAVEQQSVADKCETNLLFEVRTKTSFLQSLANVLTLGFLQPARMEYRCAKVPTQVGGIEP